MKKLFLLVLMHVIAYSRLYALDEKQTLAPEKQAFVQQVSKASYKEQNLLVAIAGAAWLDSGVGFLTAWFATNPVTCGIGSAIAASCCVTGLSFAGQALDDLQEIQRKEPTLEAMIELKTIR